MDFDFGMLSYANWLVHEEARLQHEYAGYVLAAMDAYYNRIDDWYAARYPEYYPGNSTLQDEEVL